MDIIILLIVDGSEDPGKSFTWTTPTLCSQQCLCSDYYAHVFSLVAQTVKNLPAMRETWVWSLGWEDPLEEGMATYSSILVWRIPMDRGVWWATVHVVAKNLTPLSN